MRTKFILALLILIFACAFQSWLASMNIFVDLILAALIAFAFFFDIWELLVFVLFGIFVINWQPAISLEVVLFGVIPLGVFGVHKLFRFIPAVALPIAIFIGFLVLYLAVSPATFFINWESFVTDFLGALVFGELIFLVLSRNTQ